ncbi:MAG: hypothetical protein M5U09_22840 [Gammaproteobacteria bacterium]|nr:hypothetical protein [Gammaproteobacteria bacterium]
MATEFTLTLQSTLEAYVIPGGSGAYFAKVFKGEPNALMPTPGHPLAHWKVLRTEPAPEGIRTLAGQRQLAIVFGVFAYWPLSAAAGKQRSDEDDIATVIVDLPNKPISPTLTATDYTIGGKAVALLTCENTQLVERTNPLPDSPADLRVLSFEIHARLLEAS